MTIFFACFSASASVLVMEMPKNFMKSKKSGNFIEALRVFDNGIDCQGFEVVEGIQLHAYLSG